MSARPSVFFVGASGLSLSTANFAFTRAFSPEAPTALLDLLRRTGGNTVDAVLAHSGLANDVGVHALMWLWKFDLVEIDAGLKTAPAGEGAP